MNQNQLEIKDKYYRTKIEDIEEFNELAQYLESMLHGACSVIEIDGELVLLEIKALVDKVRGMKIEVYSNEHPPPHFHVKTSDFQGSFRIDDCTIITGDIPSHDYRKIQYWHKHAKSKIIEVWNHTRPTGCVVGYYNE